MDDKDISIKDFDYLNKKHCILIDCTCESGSNCLDARESFINNKMTPTEIKAKEKADEIFKLFCTTNISDNPKRGLLMPKSAGVYFAIKNCDQVIGALNSVKGMSKIHKVKFWKLVKQNLIDKR